MTQVTGKENQTLLRHGRNQIFCNFIITGTYSPITLLSKFAGNYLSNILTNICIRIIISQNSSFMRNGLIFSSILLTKKLLIFLNNQIPLSKVKEK